MKEVLEGLKEISTQMQEQINIKFNELQEEIDRRFEKQQEEIDRRFEKQQEEIDRRFEKQQEEIDKRFEKQQEEIDKKFEKQDEKIKIIFKEQQEEIDKKFEEQDEKIKIIFKEQQKEIDKKFEERFETQNHELAIELRNIVEYICNRSDKKTNAVEQKIDKEIENNKVAHDGYNAKMYKIELSQSNLESKVYDLESSKKITSNV